MWSIHEIRRIADSMQRALRNKSNFESMLRDIENVVNDLREYNYNNQCSSYRTCKYWRAECCIYGDHCRFKHFKINKYPLDCPYGIRCKRKINGICNCVMNIRKKVNHRTFYQKSRMGNTNGNNKLNSKFNQKSINNKFNKKIITSKIANIKCSQFISNNSDRLKFTKSNNNVSDNQSDTKEEEKQIQIENNNNNSNISNNNNNNKNNNELNKEKVIMNDSLSDNISELNSSFKRNMGKSDFDYFT